MHKERRDLLVEYVERELMGPDPIDWPGLIQENGEEILITDPPTTRYIAGILFPKKTKVNSETVLDNQDDVIPENETNDDEEAYSGSASENDKNYNSYEYFEEAEELIDRSNAYKQSALSLTVAIKNDDIINLSVNAGKYKKKTEKDTETGKETQKYYRNKIEWNTQNAIHLPNKGDAIQKIEVNDTGLCVDVTFRYEKEDFSIYTFTLENTRTEESGSEEENSFFQVKIGLFSSVGFVTLPDNLKINKDEDYLSNALLYRNVKNYAVGHGCAADWKEENGEVREIHSSIFPSYEINPIIPSTTPGVSLSMLEMSDPDKHKDVVQQLGTLCDRYEEWIKKLEVEAESIEVALAGTAERHIRNCKSCLSRMRNGIKLLDSDDEVRQAFQWMNQAMLLQQLHYGLPLQKWIDDGENEIKLESLVSRLPEIDDQSTWYNSEKKVYGKWRPFQLAFILMNLESMRHPDGEEREIVDLIWFPTGGGKTEAYLGLSAYTIFLRKLLNSDSFGTSILMRYTLRLLTAQQYERAAAMICACEIIRRNNEDKLGAEEISIGLWVGGETSPNSKKDAVTKYNELYLNKTNSNPFIMLKCPWCGAQMGIVEIGKQRRLPGYRVIPGPHKSKKFVFQCSNTMQSCAFSGAHSLPLYIVDEDIYEKPPTLIIGTVDKFAILPFKPEAQKIFGYYDGIKKTAPDLIIQDELHLISGPLGSMVGHYETLINDLCTQEIESRIISPKIIASTATISRAKEQCHALYGCPTEKVFQFPPAGLNAGNSFFAEEDVTRKGRKYVGILASGSPSDATTAIRLYASLLYGAKAMDVSDEKLRDPYWTNMGYYNSIRELGQAQTWIKADISQHLDVMYKRRYTEKRFENKDEYREHRRYIWRDEELTSRIPGDKVTASLSNLNIAYPPTKDETGVVKEHPIDICLATNMISVGLDVQRLGLMTVAGQPKTTSEYIQATSRVGRDSENSPGVVFVLYRPNKPRDKSHYESFRYYHSRLYCNVEPTSVTPFSAPVRERALHAILIGLIRLEQGDAYNEEPAKYPAQDVIDHARTVIESRVNSIDFRELQDTQKQIEYILQCWEDWNPQRWIPQKNYDESLGDAVPLIYGSGNKPNVLWLDRGFKTPTSMRNVDASCEARVLNNKYMEMEE
ncbi:MAG: hypothetical protein IKP88_00735 [Lachnospiraceae bacterium]|nr:hypothetical protein [Lachnospiraceae bacterium]